MEEFLSAFHFLRPWWLLAAAVPLAGCFRFFAGMKNVSAWESVCDRKLLDFLLVRGSSRQRSLTAGLLLAGMLGAIVALAGPSWQKREIPVFTPENPVMFLLNLSSDMDETDVTPNRLARAKYAVSDLLKTLSGTESGLVVYTNEPFLISPLSEDGRVIDNLLRAVTPDIVPENGDRLDRALDYAVKRLRESGRDKGNIVVLAADVGQDFNLAMISAAGAYAKGYRVSVVDVAAAGSEKLKMIAEKGGGAYVSVVSGLPRLSSWLAQNGGRKLTESENEKEIWEDAGYYLLIVPLFCALYFFRRGILSVVLLLAFAGSAEAGFFLNDDQEGMRAFERQEFERAAASFRDPAWKASSYYRAGNFEEALKHFAGSDAESLYNRGNALAKSGKIEEAIKSYEKVLETAPEHEDARFNLEYLKNSSNSSSPRAADRIRTNGSSSLRRETTADRTGMTRLPASSRTAATKSKTGSRSSLPLPAAAVRKRPAAKTSSRSPRTAMSKTAAKTSAGRRRRSPKNGARRPKRKRKRLPPVKKRMTGTARATARPRRPGNSSSATFPKTPAVCFAPLFSKNIRKTVIRITDYEKVDLASDSEFFHCCAGICRGYADGKTQPQSGAGGGNFCPQSGV